MVQSHDLPNRQTLKELRAKDPTGCPKSLRIFRASLRHFWGLSWKLTSPLPWFFRGLSHHPAQHVSSRSQPFPASIPRPGEFIFQSLAFTVSLLKWFLDSQEWPQFQLPISRLLLILKFQFFSLCLCSCLLPSELLRCSGKGELDLLMSWFCPSFFVKRIQYCNTFFPQFEMIILCHDNYISLTTLRPVVVW